MSDVQILGANGQPLPPKMKQASRARYAASVAFDAAGSDHPALLNWRPNTYSGLSQLRSGDREFAAARIHDIARNDGWASAAVDRVVDETIGSGWTLNASVNAVTLGISQDEADVINDKIEALWEDFANDPGFWCDAERQTNMAGLLGLGMRHDFLDGEACAHVVWRSDESGAAISPSGYATCLHIIDPARLSNPLGQMDTASLQQGVSLDEWGAAIGYYVRRSHPNDWLPGKNPLAWDYVDRDIDGRPNFIHAFRKKRAGERRGISKLISVLKKHKQVSDIDDLEMNAISVNSALAAFVTSPYDLEELADSMGAGKVTDAMRQSVEGQSAYYQAMPLNFKNAQVNFLQPGEDVKLSQPGHPNANFEAFFRQALRNIASAAGLTYEMLTMDWSNVNYSSARAAMLVIYKSLNATRDTFAAQFMQPFYMAWLEEVFDRRLIELPSRAVSFEANRAAWCKTNWIGSGRGWIDPLREAEASGMRLSTGVSTLQAESAEQGQDWKKVSLQRAREQKYLLGLGLGLGLEPEPGRVEARIQTSQAEESPDDDIENDVNGKDGTPKARRGRSLVPLIKRG